MLNSSKKRVCIIGAGPGGLSAGMILAHAGYEVHIFEKDGDVGGRNAPLRLGEFTFELGPTFVMLPQVFRDVFALAGRKMEDYLEFERVDPLYRLRFTDGKSLRIWDNLDKRLEEIRSLFPGEETAYQKWYTDHVKKFEKTYACLTTPYLHLTDYMSRPLLRALPVMQLHKSVYQVLEGYFKTEPMRFATSFQAKYLGMSPWKCPGAFSILAFAEHGFGIFHPKGGVFQISQAMARVFQEDGGQIHLQSEVASVQMKHGIASGVTLKDGQRIEADHVIINADFASAMMQLIEEKDRPSYSNARIKKSTYSCSTLMLYLGLDKVYDIPHHNIFFGKDYQLNVQEILDGKGLPTDPAFYLQNACILDPSLAPPGKSTLYVLVPVSNLVHSTYNWKSDKKKLRDMIVRAIMEKTELKDLDQHIEVERVITPMDWEGEKNVYRGAVFNLAHSLTQMLYLRPHNRLNDTKNVYLVGGGTHPGSGLPTILESGRIAAALIQNS
ncbi:phytoene desaturase [Patescibacteria group bacterium]|nr:phytoene desaturase [Patescibacteria group bacterium]